METVESDPWPGTHPCYPPHLLHFLLSKRKMSAFPHIKSLSVPGSNDYRCGANVRSFLRSRSSIDERITRDIGSVEDLALLLAVSSWAAPSDPSAFIQAGRGDF